MIARGCLTAALASLGVAGACGGKKPAAKQPIVKTGGPKEPEAKPETEDDRERKRRSAAQQIIPDGTTCLPLALKADNAPQLELANVKNDAVICANDTDRSRLLGPIACWKVDLGEQALVYQEAMPLPGKNLTVKLDDRCARGFCLPKEAKLPDDKIVHMAWSEDASKVVMITGDEAHLFDATARAHESAFSIRGDKGVTNTPSGVWWVDGTIFIEGRDAGPASYVFAFKLDGAPAGALMSLGGKETMLSTYGGSFLVLGNNRVGIAEKGFSTVTTYDVDSGKRAKMVRKVTNGPCKPAEVEAFWTDGELNQKCRDHMTKMFGAYIGADAVLGRTSFLVLMRGARLGELAVLDAKTLAEKNAIKLPWCEGGAAADADGKSEKRDPPDKAEKAADKADKAESRTRAPTKKKASKTEDPDAGGE